MKKILWVWVAWFVLWGFSWPINSYADPKKSHEKVIYDVIPVKALCVAPVSETFLRKLPATVMAEVETQLAFRVAGRISKLSVHVGQVVQKGDVIARLDPSDFEDTTGEADAALAQAMARQKDADLHLRRMQKLWADQDVDISELENARADARAADDQVRIQRRQLSEAKRNLSYTRLLAPYTGMVARKNVNVFDTVSAGQPVILFVDLSQLKARGQLAASLLPEQSFFQSYTLMIPSLNHLRLKGTLEGIGPRALPSANTFPITVMVYPGANTGLRPGMNGLLEITVKRQVVERFVEIPLTAVSTTAKGESRVWVVDQKSETVAPRPVQLGKVTASGIEIKKGLRPGEWVVTAGINQLKSGQKVRILKEQ